MSLNSAMSTLRGSKNTTFTQKKSHLVPLFSPYISTCVACKLQEFWERVVMQENRQEFRPNEEGLFRHNQIAVNHQRSTSEPTAMPRPMMSRCTCISYHWGTQNPEHKHCMRPRKARCKRKRSRREGGGEREAVDCRRWCEEGTKTGKDDRWRGLPHRYKHQSWQRGTIK